MVEYTWLVCPLCGEKIGPYNHDIEARRAREGFGSYCSEGCKKVVKPNYI